MVIFVIEFHAPDTDDMDMSLKKLATKLVIFSFFTTIRYNKCISNSQTNTDMIIPASLFIKKSKADTDINMNIIT